MIRKLLALFLLAFCLVTTGCSNSSVKLGDISDSKIVRLETDGDLGDVLSKVSDDGNYEILDKTGKPFSKTIKSNIKLTDSKLCNSMLSVDSSPALSVDTIEVDGFWGVEVKISNNGITKIGDYIDGEVSYECDNNKSTPLNLTAKVVSPFKIVNTEDNELPDPSIVNGVYSYDYGVIDLMDYGGVFTSTTAPYRIEKKEGFLKDDSFDLKDISLDHIGDGFIFENYVEKPSYMNKTNTAFVVAPVVSGIKNGQHSLLVSASIKMKSGSIYQVSFTTRFNLRNSDVL